jgi:hypothetical protein
MQQKQRTRCGWLTFVYSTRTSGFPATLRHDLISGKKSIGMEVSYRFDVGSCKALRRFYDYVMIKRSRIEMKFWLRCNSWHGTFDNDDFCALKASCYCGVISWSGSLLQGWTLRCFECPGASGISELTPS